MRTPTNRSCWNMTPIAYRGSRSRGLVSPGREPIQSSPKSTPPDPAGRRRLVSVTISVERRCTQFATLRFESACSRSSFARRKSVPTRTSEHATGRHIAKFQRLFTVLLAPSSIQPARPRPAARLGFTWRRVHVAPSPTKTSHCDNAHQPDPKNVTFD